MDALRGLTLGLIKEEAIESQKKKKDYITTVGDFRLLESGIAVTKLRERYADGSCADVGEEREVRLTGNALSQYYGLLGIPVGYANKMPFELMVPHIEHARKELNSENQLLLRNMNIGDENRPIEFARAILSTRYGIFDNTEILDGLIETFGHDMRVVNYHTDEFYDAINLRLVDRSYSEIGLDPKGKSNPYYGGVHITNGETGRYSLSMTALIYEEWCTNGAIRERFGEALFRMKHFGDSGRLVESFSNAKMALPEIYADSMNSFKESQHQVVDMPIVALYNLIKSNSGLFNAKLSRETILSYDARNEETRYGIASAITEAAQKVEVDRRLRAEKLAGNILFFGLPMDTHGNIHKIQKDIEAIRYAEV